MPRQPPVKNRIDAAERPSCEGSDSQYQCFHAAPEKPDDV